MRDIRDIIKLVCNYLDKNNISYVLICGVTLPLIGTPRTTADVNIMINLLPKDTLKFVEFLKKNDFATEEWNMNSA